MSSSTIALHTVRSDRRLLICLSHLRWDFVYQRPQHLMTRASLTLAPCLLRRGTRRRRAV